ncbi:MAG TPA: ATP synthase subunit I [Sulfuriferula sp.]|nr:ATP synthase subunit I [Sulfuriferula sp.]
MRAIIPQHQKPNLVIRRALLVQGGLVLVAAILVYAIYGQARTLAVIYGGLVTLANSILLAWRMRAAKRRINPDVGQDLRMLYRTSLERFVLVVAFLALGMGILKLDPLALIAGFVLGQLAWLVGVTTSGVGHIED